MGQTHHAKAHGIVGIDSCAKLMLHADGLDGGDTFTDETGKTPGGCTCLPACAYVRRQAAPLL